MFGRKSKPEPEQGRGRRQVRRTVAGPAFSYYTSRVVPEAAPRRTAIRQSQEMPGTGKGRQIPRSLSQVPFWILLAVITLCLLKVLYLSTNPKIVVLGNTAVSATYLRSQSTYTQAAHTQLASSITNRSKLTVNLNGTVVALEHEFPELADVSMTVPLISSRPIIYIQVAQPSLALQTTHGNYALSTSGLVLARLRTMPSGVPVAVDQSGAALQPGKQYLPSSTVAFIHTVAYQFAAAKLTISTFVLPAATPYELDVRLENQTYVIKCNLQGDPLVQSGAAIATIQHLGGSPPAQYLDVRVPDRVYYK